MAGSGRRGGDFRVIAALASGSTITAAAAASGVSVRTIYRRLQEEAFRRQVSEARGELLNRTVGVLADASSEAAQTLRRLLGARSEMVRAIAARSIIELAVKLRSETELEARIAALEARAGEGQAYGYPAPLRTA